MKQFVLFLMVACVLSEFVRAEVVVYKTVQTNVWTGNGKTIKEAVSGRLVFDPDAAENPKVLTFFPGRNFQVDCPYMTIKYMRGPGNSGQSALFINGSGTDNTNIVGIIQTFLRGTNSNLLIGTDSRIVSPKILRGTWHGALRDSNGVDYVGQANVVATFQSGATRGANAAGQTVDDVINSLVETYTNSGWTEVAPDVPCP